MDDHFDTSGVFEISKFDISKFACITKTKGSIQKPLRITKGNNSNSIGP